MPRPSSFVLVVSLKVIAVVAGLMNVSVHLLNRSSCEMVLMF